MKNLFEISSEEKKRILEMHIVASKKQYLFEQKKTLKITVFDERNKPLEFVTIIDSGDKTNGATTNIDGVATLDNFVGPLFNVTFVGMESQQITPKPNETEINVILKDSLSLKTLEIRVNQFDLQVINSKSKLPVPNCTILTKNKVGDDVKLITNDEGKTKFDGTYDFNIKISKDGYVDKQYNIDDKFKENVKKETLVIELDEIIVTTSELEYLIGKTYIFEDKDLREPKTFKIKNASYTQKDDYTTVEMEMTDTENNETSYVIYDCGRVIFMYYQKNNEGKRKIGRGFLYQSELSKYLLNKTKCCNNI